MHVFHERQGRVYKGTLSTAVRILSGGGGRRLKRGWGNKLFSGKGLMINIESGPSAETPSAFLG
jgi:hypothetical protein